MSLKYQQSTKVSPIVFESKRKLIKERRKQQEARNAEDQWDWLSPECISRNLSDRSAH